MDYLILALATWRISSLLVSESGPWDILAKFRTFIGVYYDEQSDPQGKNMIARAMTCVWCISLWVAIILSVFFLVEPFITTMIALPFGLSATAILFEEFINGKS